MTFLFSGEDEKNWKCLPHGELIKFKFFSHCKDADLDSWSWYESAAAGNMSSTYSELFHAWERWQTDRAGGRSVGFVLVFRNFFCEDIPWTTIYFCMALRHSCLGKTLVFVSTGHTRQMVFELDRTEIFRTNFSLLIVGMQANITRASLSYAD